MKHYTNTEEAALDFLGEEAQATRSRKAAVFRTLVTQNPAILQNVMHTYGDTLPVSAYAPLAATFGGRASLFLAPLLRDDLPREGFYLRGQDRFHAASDTFEQRADKAFDLANSEVRNFIEAGINVYQASDLMPLGSTAFCLFSGSVMDWAEAYNSNVPVAAASHPATREFLIAVWADIQTRMPLLAEAFVEKP